MAPFGRSEGGIQNSWKTPLPLFCLQYDLFDGWSLCLWSVHVLPLPVSILSGCSGLLIQSN